MQKDDGRPGTWKQADDLTGFKWPLAGYAPGDYMGTCRSCGTQMVGCDKRARQCLSCAIGELRDGYEEIDRAFRVKVWNEAKKAGLSDRAAMDEVARQRAALMKQVIGTTPAIPVACDAPITPIEGTSHAD